MKNFFITHVRIIVLLLIIVVASGTVWFLFSNAAPTLGTYTVTRGNIVSALDLPGTVSSSDSVSLSFQESGQIAQMYVREGQAVTAGEVLASLDDSNQET